MSHGSVEGIHFTTTANILFTQTWTLKSFLRQVYAHFYFVPGMLIFALFGTFATITVSFISCFPSLKIWPLFSSQRNEQRKGLQCVLLGHKRNDTVPLNLIEPFCGWTCILGKVPQQLVLLSGKFNFKTDFTHEARPACTFHYCCHCHHAVFQP